MKTLIKLTFVVAFFVATFQSVALAQNPYNDFVVKTFDLPVHASMENRVDMENFVRQSNQEIANLALNGFEVEVYSIRLGDDFGVDAFRFFVKKVKHPTKRRIVFVGIKHQPWLDKFTPFEKEGLMKKIGLDLFEKEQVLGLTTALVDWIESRQEGRFVGFFTLLKSEDVPLKSGDPTPLVVRIIPVDPNSDESKLASN